MNALFAWLWQGAAIALATAVLLAPMRRVNAATRHAIWWCALAAVLGAPVIRALLNATAASAAATEATLPTAVLVVQAPPDSVIAMIIGAWLGTVLVGIIKIATGLHSLARLKAESRPFDAARESRLLMWRSSAADARRPALRVSDGARAACALGLRQPVILLSQGLVDALDDAALDQVVMHEYAHLLRADDWLRLLESAVVSIAGLHPAVRFITRQIDLEREAACDDMVVSRTGGACAYAACLAGAAVVAHSASSDVARQLVPSATGATVSLRSRIVRLLDPRRARTARLAPPAIGVAIVTLGFALALSHHVAPVLVVDHHPDLSTPAVRPASVAQASPLAPAKAGVAVARVSAPISVRGGGSASERVVARPVRMQVTAQLPPSEVVGTLSGAASDIAPAPLASSSIAAGVHTPVAVPDGLVPAGGSGAGPRSGNVKWSSLARPGVAVGRGAKSIAGFFGGAAKAVATSF